MTQVMYQKRKQLMTFKNQEIIVSGDSSHCLSFATIKGMKSVVLLINIAYNIM